MIIMGALTLSAISGIVGRILLSLGVSFLMLQGFSELLTYARQAIESHLGTLGANVLNYLGLCGADYLVNALFAGYSALSAMSVAKKMMMK